MTEAEAEAKFEEERDYWYERALEWGDYHHDQVDELYAQAYEFFLEESGIEIEETE